MNNTIAVITPSPARRLVSVSILFGLGIFVLFLTFTRPPSTVMWQIFLILFGLIALVTGEKLRRATLLTILMTDEVLCDSSGQVICQLDDISGIDRGAFAFKPANGFLLRTNTKLGRNWSPGLWWRMGRRIGVGGATSARQGKFMAEAIAMRLAAHQSD